MKPLLLSIFFTLSLAGSWSGAQPAWSAPVQRPHIEVELVSETRSVRPGMPFWVALRMKMDPEWHTYWINPGDSGMKTSLTWTLPPGFTAGPIEWPYPHRLPVPPLMNYGYEGEVFLLTRIDPPTKLALGEFRVEAKADWLVCKETCIPGKASLDLTLPAKNGDPVAHSDWAEGFRLARRKIPAEAVGWKFSAAASARKWILKGIAPVGQAALTEEDAVFFPLESGLVEPAAPVHVRARGAETSIELKRPEKPAGTPERLSGVLVLVKEDRAIRVDAPVKPLRMASIWLMLLFAIAGGLILNVMPCVFPVISMKILGFVEISRHDPGQVRKHGLLFCLGALLSFWVLAAILILLRAGGQSLGWGFQLQSPGFVVCLALLFHFMGMNLMGFFELGTRVMGIGQGLAGRKSYSGSFFSGVLATVVATPCTGPFMGAALGFALSQSAWTGFMVFTALAFGMIAPYLILSLAPGMLRDLPKPGRWMETFKQFLSFPLFLTVLWLAWVLGTQAGLEAVIALFGALIACSAGVWVRYRWNSRGWSWIIAVLLVLGGLGWALEQASVGSARVLERFRAVQSGGSAETGLTVAGMPAEPFSAERIAELRAKGHPVFVDFTAAWCVTCQVNERVVFASPEVRASFAELGVKIVKADWTHRDEKITRELEEHGRSGVPLYLLYSPRAEVPALVLPEVLSPGTMLEALATIDKPNEKR